MGCDIHMWAEINSRRAVSDWMKVGAAFNNPYHRPGEDIVEGWNEPMTDHPLQERNYHLFAVLADVRNSWQVVPVVPPRGVPGDVSKEVRKEVEDWGCDGHSHSWLTLAELKAYNMDEHFYAKFEPAAQVVIRKWFPQDWSLLIANLEKVRNGRSDDLIRIVFCFDN